MIRASYGTWYEDLRAFVRAQAKGAFDLAAVTELADKAEQALDGQ